MSSPLAVLRRLRPPADADPLTAYATTRDPQLLAELVRRHGGLVWGVCRRTLPHRPDAEDAYQATWLVLVANPGAVRSPAALPAFLHTVAVRASRRVRQKRPLTVDADHLPDRASADREGLAALDAELERLPNALRQPLVLCYLDGRTQDEAAKELGLSLSTLKRRLEAGKELLRSRLAGRGIDVAAVLTGVGLTGVGAPVVTAGGAGVAATALSTEVLTAMWILKAKGWAAGLVLAAGLTATGGGLMLADDPAKPAAGPGKVVAASERPADKPVGWEGTEPVTLKDENFEVYAPTVDQATQIHRAANAARYALAVRWLGKELPAWERRCVITYKPGSGGTDGGGATHFAFGPAGVTTTMRMELFGSLPKVLTDALPHEVMHTVLATHFGKAVPRWADEGVGLMAESEGSRAAHDRRIRELLNQGRGLSLRVLFPMTEYPKDMHVLYAQGYSVCRFLLHRTSQSGRGEAALLEFVRRGMADGWPDAAKGVYGFADLDAMQAEWIASLKVPATDPPVARPAPAVGVTDPAVVAAPAVPARLLQERVTTARRFLDLDRQIRDLGAIPKEEASAFEINLRMTARTLYDAVVGLDPSPAGRLAAAREWYVNTFDAESFYQARAVRGLNREQVAMASRLARIEAEVALLQALAVAPPAARDRHDPFPAAAGYAGKVSGFGTGVPFVRPAAGLKPLTAVRVSRDGKPVGVLVVTNIPREGGDTASGVLLPTADGTFPTVQVGDDVRP